MLSTLPGIKHIHSQGAWGLCCAAWVIVCGIFGYAYFSAVLQHTSAMLPALALLLLGLVLGKKRAVFGSSVSSSFDSMALRFSFTLIL